MQMEIPTDPLPAGLVREQSLWFTDATLVIQAETRLFRVSHGILAAKSPVFQDMLAFPQPENEETYDGCPLVHLLDSAQDTTYFLKAIFHYDFFEGWPADLDFDVVAGVLRLSQKYQVEPLKKRALVHLSERYPTSVDQAYGADEWHVSPILIVNLAREVSADWVLPWILSTCAWSAPEELLKGVEYDGRRVWLAQSDAMLCLRARDALQTKWTSKLLDFLWTPMEISNCASPLACLNKRIACRREAEQYRDDQILVLCLWNDDDWYDLGEGVCFPCLSFMKSAHEDAKHAFWDQLPALFGLPDWDTLLGMKSVALN